VSGTVRDNRSRCDRNESTSLATARSTSYPAADCTTESRAELSRHEIVQDRIGCRTEVIQNAYTQSQSFSRSRKNIQFIRLCKYDERLSEISAGKKTIFRKRFKVFSFVRFLKFVFVFF